ncbi:hypothetical protein NitYY0826_C0065 [Nitratiruptor sp. YY08-26]|uniref:sigma 54-interacting transcriptional regulator n=1 Tax=unclassified Nitratiruptor TaxID=2624044 RepID=UPI00191543D7|nr:MULTISPECIES: hypothetical protein [unclassified Nitratiruptor]BCD61232.1 hypothetical protein NitYY0813_C0065 [Nitratiruptor sp. YY08-13]BCD65165.1 hypothetical protein NitYY0826_C0065 [Nitratiruptor sp. YY08-26]
MRTFVAKSPQTIKAFNILQAAANLPVNIAIIGERGTGKETLVNEVFPHIPRYSVASLPQKIESKEIFIRDFENIENLHFFMRSIQGVRLIVAVTKFQEELDEFFPIQVTIPPLRERPEDLEELKHIYIQKVKEEFELEEFPQDFIPDLQSNAISLKKSIYEKALLSSMDEEEIMQLLEQYLENRVEEGYKELLYLFEVPLLRAAKKKCKSVLAMSKALELNRATLTSKLKRYASKI